MRFLILIGVLFFTMSNGVIAQNRSIQFEQGKWQEISDKAKKAKKMIFVDCYTSWCEPCKKLSSEVFTQDSVADYFNKVFVNAHFDMEKDADGQMLLAKYEVSAFPTLLFIDPTTGVCVHRALGAGDAQWLLNQAKQAQNPNDNLSGMARRYKAGERDTSFICSYLKMLDAVNMEQEKREITNDFMKAIPDKVFFTKQVWNLVFETTYSPLDESFKRIMSNREKSNEYWGKEKVDRFLRRVLRNEVFVIYNWKRIRQKPFDESRSEKLVSYLKTVSSPEVAQVLVELKAAKCARNNDFAGVLSSMRDAYKFNVFVTGEGPSFFLESMELFKECKDVAIIEEAIAWIDQEINQTENYFYKSNLSHAKYLLYKSLGRAEEAKDANNKKYDYFDEGSRQCGGRVLRAMKPE